MLPDMVEVDVNGVLIAPGTEKESGGSTSGGGA